MPSERGETGIRERPVDHELDRLGLEGHQVEVRLYVFPGAKRGDLVEKAKSGIGDIASGGKTAQTRQTGQRAKHAIAKVRSDKVGPFELAALA
ncbi:MAG: hypothetical protein SFV18_05610 [Bryobacteraceae bacterium]|nr:hypothetical protein [Bryobacteraceae bacterium]